LSNGAGGDRDISSGGSGGARDWSGRRFPEGRVEPGRHGHGRDVESLRTEGAISLRVYLEACQKKGIELYRSYSGRLNVRFPPELHEIAARKSEAEGKSLNDLIVEAVREAVTE
jgi:predicted HicB family RNase H-like nuclease